jgi:Domain of unknown function (DUF4350)
MKKPGPVTLLALLAAIFAGGALYLFNRRFEGGGAYPAYSTLRADRGGAKVIFESLGRLPGMTVARSYQPLERLPDRDSTVLLLGVAPYTFAMQPDSELQALEEFARRGNRLVFAMGEGVGREPPRPATLEKLWGVRVGLEFDKEGRGNPYFAEAKDWEILDRRGTRALVVEKPFGTGSIVLAADSRLFDNQSVAGAAQTALLARIIGSRTRVVFDESHFGIVESGSIVALARHFRLHGLAIGLAIISLLFIWRNVSSFPPVAVAPRVETVSGRTSVAGLVTLLRRHIAPDGLAAVCRQEWLKSPARDMTPARRAQAEAALREIQAIVHAKGAS